MNKKYFIFFIILCSFSSPLINLLFGWQHKQLIAHFHHETRTLHNSIAERFGLLMESHRAIGIVSSEYLASGRLQSKEYNDLTANILRNFDEILGLNVVDADGVIVQVSPEIGNHMALGKITQHFKELRESSLRREQFWLSPPFELYQGERGFAFYMPFYKNDKLMGWIAPVISQKTFFKKFIKSDILQNYHFIINDEETGLSYFSTALIPARPVELFKNTIQIWGRKVTFISWPINNQQLSRNQLLASIIISLLFSGLATISLWLYENKTRARKRLDALTSLLRITVQDTNNSLLSIHNQLNQMKLGTSQAQLERVTKHIGYISTLLRQIEVLQKLSGNKTSVDFQITPVLPMILELTELLNESLEAKKIVIDFDPQELSRIEVMADIWLLCHSVFAHFLRQAINLSPINSDILVRHYRQNNFRCFEIQHTGPSFSDDLIEGRISDEGNFVAEKVVHLHNGKLFFSNTPKGGKVTIKLPIPK
jgi:hypothetical protein